jgi:hypothetical protein
LTALVVFEAWVGFDGVETFDFTRRLVDFVAQVVFDTAGGL